MDSLSNSLEIDRKYLIMLSKLSDNKLISDTASCALKFRNSRIFYKNSIIEITRKKQKKNTLRPSKIKYNPFTLNSFVEMKLSSFTTTGCFKKVLIRLEGFPFKKETK